MFENKRLISQIKKIDSVLNSVHGKMMIMIRENNASYDTTGFLYDSVESLVETKKLFAFFASADEMSLSRKHLPFGLKAKTRNRRDDRELCTLCLAGEQKIIIKEKT